MENLVNKVGFWISFPFFLIQSSTFLFALGKKWEGFLVIKHVPCKDKKSTEMKLGFQRRLLEMA